MKNVNPKTVLGLNKAFADLQHRKFLENDFKFFRDYTFFIKKFSGRDHFIIGEVFKHRDDSCVQQYHVDDFMNNLFDQSLLKTIIVPHCIDVLKEFVLKREMNSEKIQTETFSIPMEENMFWIVLFCLIIKPKLGKELLGYALRKDETNYILHFKKNDDTVWTFGVRWNGDEWELNSGVFTSVSVCFRDYVFLYFTTDKK